ncbi:AraC family transcriptional regulator [Clostridium boliviensis]|uniref:AraC family transcriptional regulator n=1 Tax=Clostridium boliviensis TaxID=318465 RepID=A0ABU4GN80_9CLOT|nr:AraC family transcriptional regulator [Clostridium boliviensis]MDW2799074.1 AraC family transcriptional regulator [Clostridium boliviensis]
MNIGNYTDYLKRMHVFGQVDMYLFTLNGESVFRLQRNIELNKNRQKDALDQFLKSLFFSHKPGKKGLEVVISTYEDYSFGAQIIALEKEVYFLVIGPFYLKHIQWQNPVTKLRRFTLEELRGFLPLFTADEVEGNMFKIYERSPEKENEDTSIFEAISYNDDTKIKDNAVLEQTIMNAIKTGDTQLLNELRKHTFFSNPDHYEVGSDLRKEKNLALMINSLASRAAAQGGMAVVYARSICARYAAKIEETKTEAELFILRQEISLSYAKKVKELRAQGYSPLIRRCISYMEIHLSEEIRLGQLAELYNISYEHLSRMIKKECQCSFSQLLNRIRIERAQSYLLMNLPIVDIAEKTGYKSTSHFCNVFKNQTGMTTGEWYKKAISE